MKQFIFILFLFLISWNAFAQTDTDRSDLPDTELQRVPQLLPKPVKKRVQGDTFKRHILSDTVKSDTIKTAGNIVKTDSSISHNSDTTKAESLIATKAVRQNSIKKPVDSIYLKLLDNPFLRTKAKPIFLVVNERNRISKDEIFYLLLGLLLFLAFIKLSFSKYFKNIFRLFFQPSFRQKQTREQLLQNNLPSLLLNLFFVLSAGTYSTFLLKYYRLTNTSLWWLLLYSAASLLILYVGKFIFLSFAGWVFNVKEATESYIFAVNLINKILGVVLVPFTFIIAFSPTNAIDISITISGILIVLFYLYRYLISYGSVLREVKVNALHFFLYVFAFEITPLLLIYKTLMIYLDNSL